MTVVRVTGDGAAPIRLRLISSPPATRMRLGAVEAVRLRFQSGLPGATGAPGATGPTGDDFPNFATKAEAAAATIPADTSYAWTAGYATVGDGGGALYKKLVGAAPITAARFQSADGAYWEYVPSELGYNVLCFGADPTFTADSAAAVQAAIAMAPSGSQIIFPPGQYKLNSPLAYSDKALSFFGPSGTDSAVLRFQSCSGIVVTLSAQPGLDAPWTLCVRDLTLSTNNTSDVTTYKAIEISAPDLLVDGGASQRGLVVENCIFDGEERFNGWWPFSIYVRNVSNNRVDHTFSYSKANHAKGFGFVFSGHSTHCNVSDCYIWFNVVAIQQDGTGYTNWASEALVINNCNIRAQIGARKIHSASNGEPQFQVFGSHLNCTYVCIYSDNSYEVQITDCLLYLQEMAFEAINANPVGIWLSDSGGATVNQDFLIRSTYVRQLTAAGGTSRGVHADMSVGLIDGCSFRGFTRGIEIAATRTTIHVSRNNRYPSCTTPVLNSGASNTQDAATVAL